MKKILSCLTITMAFLLLCIGVTGCSKRKSNAKANGDSTTPASVAIPAPQSDYRNTPLFKTLLYTRYLNEYSDVVLSDYDPISKKLRLVSVIQGKSWFTEDDSTKVPDDFRWEVTDHPNRLVLFRNRSNPSPISNGFRDKVTKEEVRRLEELGKEPYSSPEERTEAFLNSWSDIALVRCNQIDGSVQGFYAYKGNHIKSNDDINRYKELIIHDTYKGSYECILYGNFESEKPEVHVAWIAYSYLIFPGRQSILADDFKSAASKLRKK